MKKKFSLLALLMSTAFSTLAQNQVPGGRVKQALLRPDGTPSLIALKEGQARYKITEASQALREQLQLSSDDQMIRLKTEVDARGVTHEKYQQYYRGVKVEHGIYSVHAQAEQIESLTGNIKHVGQLNVTPKLSSKDALKFAIDFVGAKEYMWQLPLEEEALKQRSSNPAASYQPQGELVLVSNKREELVLAWKFDIYAREPISRSYIYVDAHSGEIAFQDAIMKHVTASFATRYSGTRNVETQVAPSGGYRLRDVTRGNGVETYNASRLNTIGGASDFIDNDNNWTAAEYNNANFDNAAGDAHFGAEATYDYWRNVHNRNSWDNAGGVLRNYVHFGQGYENAGWTGSEMIYGDGSTQFKPLTALDVTGHEIGHGVCQKTAALVYQGESGALNEGFSDIWGACIEQYTCANLGLTKSTWLLGEEIVNSGPALRSMSDPKSLGQPSYYRGQNWYSGTNDNGGVHTNSGVLNHWFYILSQGKSGINEGGSSYSVSGIGITSAARIAYLAESVYLTSNSPTPYADARTFTIKAAGDIFGACSPEVAATTDAWSAVGIGAPAHVTGRYDAQPLYSSGTELQTYQFVPANNQYTITLDQAYDFTFTSNTSGTPAVPVAKLGPNTATFYFPGSSVQIIATATNSPCPLTSSFIFLAPFSYAVMPNPTSSELIVSTVEPNQVTADRKQLPEDATRPEFTADLFDGFGNKVQTGRSVKGQATLDVRALPNGLYNLRVGTGKNAHTEHIQVTH
jgi:bacillolysin